MPNSCKSIIKRLRHNRAITQAEFDKLMRKLDGWIPCSERMPEDGDTYIVSGYEMWEGKKLPFVDCATFPGSYIDDWDTYNDWFEGQEVHIIAWQEMPEALEDEE